MKIPAFTKSYHGRCVLQMPDTELPDGRITAVLGANGSGKSTLARVLAGIEPPDGKRALPGCRRIGYMPQKSYAFRMSTQRNVLLNADDPARAGQLLFALGLDALRRHPAKKLSGGETAKMALARLLAGQYELLILDEPTAAMDMESTLAAEKLIRLYSAEHGCTVLLITHSIQQARRIADHLLVFHEAELIEQGAAGRVLNAPEQAQTKRFLEFFGR